jgi:alkanesulfonate monooxygenase SsuD/methylene tetrahydromethanopterin reductase-like flavin-dependent oxidoreductase (luciferase family)
LAANAAGREPKAARDVRVALMIEGQEGVSWEQWLALARACEEGGIEALFRSDHYQSVGHDPRRLALDAWATISALAAVTERVRLGTLVSPVTFRRAGEIAKVVATADHVSGGRVELGLGAGWNEREHEAFGFPFPDLRARMDELEQQLQHVRRQWAELSPPSVQQPRPPLIVGGTGGPRSCRLGARYADEYNTVFASVDDCAERKKRVDSACRAEGREPIAFSLMTGCVVGRDRAEVERRAGAVTERTGLEVADLLESDQTITGTVEQVVARIGEYAEVGVERVYLQHLDHADVEMVELIGAEVVLSVASC